MCIYVYIYPYASPLDYAIPFSLTKIPLMPVSVFPSLISAVDFDSE